MSESVAFDAMSAVADCRPAEIKQNYSSVVFKATKTKQALHR